MNQLILTFVWPQLIPVLVENGNFEVIPCFFRLLRIGVNSHPDLFSVEQLRLSEVYMLKNGFSVVISVPIVSITVHKAIIA